MKFFPSGRLHKMQSQVFSDSQLDQVFSGLTEFSDSNKTTPEVEQQSNGTDIKLSSNKSFKNFIKEELINNFNIEERLLGIRSGWYSEKIDFSSNDRSGFFLIPLFSGEQEFSEEDIKNLFSRVKKSFPDLHLIMDGSDGNYKIIFKTIIKSEPEKSNSSFDSLPEVKKIASSGDIFSELFNQRKEYLYRKLRDIK